MNKLVCTLLASVALAGYAEMEDRRDERLADEMAQCFNYASSDLTDETMGQCLMTFDNTTTDNGSLCAFRCTQEAIAHYWSCAADCIERQAPDWCITNVCQGKVIAFDIPCLKSCSTDADFLE
jgi:hypothetical protein